MGEGHCTKQLVDSLPSPADLCQSPSIPPFIHEIYELNLKGRGVFLFLSHSLACTFPLSLLFPFPFPPPYRNSYPVFSPSFSLTFVFLPFFILSLHLPFPLSNALFRQLSSLPIQFPSTSFTATSPSPSPPFYLVQQLCSITKHCTDNCFIHMDLVFTILHEINTLR